MIFLNSVSSAAALVFYLSGVCTHTDTEGKQGEARVRNIFKNIPGSGLSLFSLGVSVCTHTRQVEDQRYSRTGRVQKDHNILRKKHNI